MIEETGKPVILSRDLEGDLWTAADRILYQWARTAPIQGYDKVDFTVVYDDGEKYTGRYDLKHHSVEYPNLAKHVYDFVRFTAGKYKGALSQEEYGRFKEQPHFQKLSPEFLKFLKKYEIGTYNLMEQTSSEANTLAEKAVKKGADPEEVGRLLVEAEWPIDPWLKGEKRREALNKRSAALLRLKELAGKGEYVPKTGLYEGGWKPGDVAIYTDFGLRSLFIVQILPWPVEKPDRFTDDMGVVHNRILGSVRAKVIDTSMVDWDFQRPPRIGKEREVGTTHYYHFTNLYRDIHDLMLHEAKVLKQDVWNKTVKDLKAHAGWEVLKRFGLTGPETLKLGEKMKEVLKEKKASYVTIEDPGKTTFTKGSIVSTEAFVEENERVRKREEKEATGWFGDVGEWPHKGNGGGNADLELVPRCSRLPQTSKIDIRQDYDEKASVNEGTLYRKGSVIQVWWDKWGKETWSGPDEKEAKRNFQAMKERWTEPISAQARNEPARRPKREGDLEYFADSPEFLANTIEQTGWREQLDKEFQLAIARTRS